MWSSVFCNYGIHEDRYIGDILKEGNSSRRQQYIMTSAPQNSQRTRLVVIQEKSTNAVEARHTCIALYGLFTDGSAERSAGPGGVASRSHMRMRRHAVLEDPPETSVQHNDLAILTMLPEL